MSVNGEGGGDEAANKKKPDAHCLFKDLFFLLCVAVAPGAAPLSSVQTQSTQACSLLQVSMRFLIAGPGLNKPLQSDFTYIA